MEEYQNCNCIERLEELSSTVQKLRIRIQRHHTRLLEEIENHISYLPAAGNMSNTPQYMKFRTFLNDWDSAVYKAHKDIWLLLRKQRRNGHIAPATRRQSRRLLKQHQDLVRNVGEPGLLVYDDISKALTSFASVRRNHAEWLIPSVNISKQQAENGDLCAVCLETFEVDETVRQLGCEHCFHTDCMEPLIKIGWRERNNFPCPLCRRPYLARQT